MMIDKHKLPVDIMIIQDYLNNLFMDILPKINLAQEITTIEFATRSKNFQFQCNSPMKFAKKYKKNSMTIAKSIVKELFKYYSIIFKDLIIIFPGFININLHENIISDWNNKMFNSSSLGCPTTKKYKKVILDFGGPNIAKPLHVGHLRSLLIGDCLQRVYRFYGDKVLTDVHLGDWGTQIGMIFHEISKTHSHLSYFKDNIEDDIYTSKFPFNLKELSHFYAKACKNCKKNPLEMQKARQITVELQKGRKGYNLLWKQLMDITIPELKNNFLKLGINFDLWKSESNVKYLIPNMIKNMINKKIAIPSQGAIIVPIDNDNNKNIPPLILIKSDGGIMYSTTDLATIVERTNKYQPEHIIYVVDKRQTIHFKQVFYVAKKAGISLKKTKMTHLGFGTVNNTDGKPFKSREGSVMELTELINKIKKQFKELLDKKQEWSNTDKEIVTNDLTLATLKFADLSNIYSSNYIFDLTKMSSYEGKTGPYILYSAVRIQSIFNKIDHAVMKKCNTIHNAINSYERNLQITLTQLPYFLKKTYHNCEPHHLCEYAYKIAFTFNKFYSKCLILKEQKILLKYSRIALCKWTLKQLTMILKLLGINIPKKM